MGSEDHSEVLFIGGAAGVGKSTVALEVSHLLEQAEVRHAVIEGDNLDLAYPAPWRSGLMLAERNLAAMWRNYRDAGYSRLIYTNTVSVLEMKSLEEAMGGNVRGMGVLLTGDDATRHARLAVREVGSGLEIHIERSNRAARELASKAGSGIRRVRTDGRSVTELARELVEFTGWCSGHRPPEEADAARR